MKKHVSFIISLFFIVIACTPPQGNNSDEDVIAIAEVSKAIVQTWNDGNYEAFVEYIDNDAIIMPQNAPSIVGIDAIKSLYSNSFKAFTFEVSESLDEITVFGDYAYTAGKWVGAMNPVDDGDPIPFNNKLIGIYKKQPDGRWLVYRNIYNSNEIPQAPKSPELSE